MNKLYKLKLAYAIEIGAYLAYVGHFNRTGDPAIRRIGRDELRHMVLLKRMLRDHGSTPSGILNTGFYVIGTSIKLTCKVTPTPILNRVAGILEVFNVINYRGMIKDFPEYAETLREMSDCEKEHEEYFKGIKFKGVKL